MILFQYVFLLDKLIHMGGVMTPNCILLIISNVLTFTYDLECWSFHKYWTLPHKILLTAKGSRNTVLWIDQRIQKRIFLFDTGDETQNLISSSTCPPQWSLRVWCKRDFFSKVITGPRAEAKRNDAVTVM